MNTNTNDNTERHEQTGERFVPLEYLRAVCELCNIARPKLGAIAVLRIVESAESERALLHRLAATAVLSGKATNDVVVH